MTRPRFRKPVPTRGRSLLWSIALITVISLLAVAWFRFGNQDTAAQLRISEYTQLTHNGHAEVVVGTDGSRLYLTSVFSIDQVAVSGGEIETVPSITLPNPFLSDVSPDGSTFLVQSMSVDTPSLPLYTVQVVGGSHRYLADATLASGTWSRDGKFVAYTTPNGDLNVVNSEWNWCPQTCFSGRCCIPTQLVP